MITAVLVISDPDIRDQLLGRLEGLSIETVDADTLEKGMELLQVPGLLFTDVCTSEGAGFELLDTARTDDRLLPVIVGEKQSIEAAEKVLKPGTAQFLPVPPEPGALEKVVSTFRSALEQDSRGDADSGTRDGEAGMGNEGIRRVEAKAAQGNGAVDESEGVQIQTKRVGPMVAHSTAMRRVFDQIVRMAPSSATVLVTGESGTGKEMVAHALHDLSSRSQGPFIPVNCGAISPNLMESELFGHERGSFTGATRTHRGMFERADRGTLFLDEITEMPADLQVKLLRVLETSRFTRIGAEKAQRVNVRVIAASNRPTDEAIRDGKLREDLYYRLKVLHLEIPPLRARPDDILPLAEHFLRQIIEKEGQAKQLTDPAREALRRHHWPGNAREIKNAIYTAYLLSEGSEVTFEALPPEVTNGEDEGAFYGSALQIPVGSSIDDAERRLILMTLSQLDGNKTRTAEVLGISVKTLYNRLHAYGAMETKDSGSAEA